MSVIIVVAGAGRAVDKFERVGTTSKVKEVDVLNEDARVFEFLEVSL